MKTFAVRLAGALFLLSALSGPAPAQVAATSTFSGIVTVIWGDPKPGKGGAGDMRFELTQADNTVHQLRIARAQRGEAIRLFGKRVTVEGRLEESAAPGGVAPIVVENIVAAEHSTREGVRARGTRKVLFVLLKFKGDNQETHPVTFYRDELTNPQVPPAGSKAVATINGFFKKTSWNQLQWSADVAGEGGLNPTDWFTLPNTKHGYAPCGWSGSCADLDQIRVDALALVSGAGINWRAYDNINFVLNNDLDCCAWGGSFVNGGKLFGVTWEPPWSQEASTYVHEMGHSIGLPHSGWRYYAYDSHHDEMSRGSPAKTRVCSKYESANDGRILENVVCTEPGAGYIVAHKDYLGWIPAKNKALVTGKISKNFIIEANALPLGARLKMVKVCLPGRPCSDASNQGHFLTVAARMKVAQYENGLPTEGIVIHDVLMSRENTIDGRCFFNDQSGWAVPIDATPGDFNKVKCAPQDVPGSGLMDMPFVVGTAYHNPTYGITVKVVSKTAKTYTVNVTRTK